MSKIKTLLHPRQTYIFGPYTDSRSVSFGRTTFNNKTISQPFRLYSSFPSDFLLLHRKQPSVLSSFSRKFLWSWQSTVQNTCSAHSFTATGENNSASNMSAEHLAKGSPCPPLAEGKIRLYSMLMCPFAQRSRLVAEAKGIPHEIVNCNLKEKPEWMFEKHPEGQVPILETNDGVVLYESVIVNDYLDEFYTSGRPLYSKDLYKKALDKLYIEKFRNVTTKFYGILFGIRDSVSNEEMKERISKFVESLKAFEEELGRRGTPFFAGDQPGMLDYTIWPWFERIPVVKLKCPDLFDYEAAKKQNPNLENWRQAMKKDPVVAKLIIAPERHLDFAEKYFAGTTNYASLH